MHPAVMTVFEGVRGCGRRKPGGLYLVNDGEGQDCGRLPFPLTVCPCCGEGFRPSRGYRWVDGERILQSAPTCTYKKCYEGCSFRSGNEQNVGRAMLIWISPEHYPTTQDFNLETERMGLSRRITGDALPRGFKLGQTWVFLAHRMAIGGEEPGVFNAFVPSRVEYVVTGEESDDDIDKLIKRGITPVQVFDE